MEAIETKQITVTIAGRPYPLKNKYARRSGDTQTRKRS